MTLLLLIEIFHFLKSTDAKVILQAVLLKIISTGQVGSRRNMVFYTTVGTPVEYAATMHSSTFTYTPYSRNSFSKDFTDNKMSCVVVTHKQTLTL
jgi:hypothetical protein